MIFVVRITHCVHVVGKVPHVEEHVVLAHLGLPLQPPQRLRVHAAHVAEEGDPRA